MAQAQVRTSSNVSKQFLSDSAAQRMMQDPVQMKGEKITGITIVVPLLEEPRYGKRAYLVAKVPQDRIDELKREMDRLPQSKRAAFVKSWVERNQREMIKAYLTDPSNLKITFVDAKPASGIKPVRTTEDPWAGRKTKEPEPEPETVNPWAAKPPARKPPARKKVKIEPTEKSTPKKRTITGLPRATAVPGPSARATTQASRLPKQIREGSGTSKDRYEVYKSKKQVDDLLMHPTDDVADTIIQFPITLNMGEHGVFYFNVNFTADQITKKNYEKTLDELAQILKTVMRLKRVPTGVYSGPITASVNRQIRAEIVRQQAKSDEFGKYLRTH